MRQGRFERQARAVRRSPDGIDRVVLEQKQMIWQRTVGPFRGHQCFLPRQGFLKANTAEPLNLELLAHICFAPGNPTRAPSCARKCVNPIASASAASWSGVSVRPRRARTIKATWFLPAPPRPTVACLIRAGGYSKTGNPISAAARIAAPRAAPRRMAVL